MKHIMYYFLVVFSLFLNVKAVPVTEQIYFYHYSNASQTIGTELKIGEKLSHDIDPKLPWKFFIHGWTTNPEVSPWFATGKQAYFAKSKYNIVFVDWSVPGNKTYLESVKNAGGSGAFVGKFILHLVDSGASFERIHLVGHSLGSHMTGFCGKHIIKATKGEAKLGRITALDPAGPIYEFNPLAPEEINRKFLKSLILPPSFRLDKSDAHFVDVIHTDAEQYGMKANIGHVDFHPNGGKRFQPGCENSDDDNCSHARSTQYFVESINNDNFVAKECANYELFKNGCCENNTVVNLGEYTDKTARGIFYLMTNSEPPYARGLDKSINGKISRKFCASAN